jgi:hypothetical protein
MEDDRRVVSNVWDGTEPVPPAQLFARMLDLI